ncbi:Pr6Pr family membrane protein [Microlunatus soli]|nr:Pr6Pr family membrane protein [Microlunatus soli]
MPGSRVAARCWYVGVAAVVAVGFAIQFYLLATGGADVNSGETGAGAPLEVRFARLFSYFTIGSNLIVLVVSLLAVVRPDREGPVWWVAQLDGLVSIVVTGTLFSVIVVPGIELRAGAVVANALFHQVSPVLFTVGWLVFGPRRRWSWRLAPWLLAWPVGWLIFTFVRGAVTGWYPYPIVDAGRLGLGRAIANSSIVLGYAIVLILLAAAVDRWIPYLGGRHRTPGRPAAGLDVADN